MKLYPGVGWKAKCARMPENQVIAIYLNCKKRGTFEKKAKENKGKPMTAKDEGYQFTVFDYMEETKC